MERISFGLLLMVLLLCGCSKSLSCSGRPLPETAMAGKTNYLENICQELRKQWPNNRTVTIVCHGHSVPAGYFNTPTVKPFDAYPHLLHKALQEKYPYAVINVIVTAIGGEHSVDGANRFTADVLTHKPDLILIDYALNDRNVGLNEAAEAWSMMIEESIKQDVKVLLLTPTPDIHHIPGNRQEALNQHADQIRSLAVKYNVGLVDSLTALDDEMKRGTKIEYLLSNGYNHPNRIAHEIVVREIMEWF